MVSSSLVSLPLVALLSITKPNRTSETLGSDDAILPGFNSPAVLPPPGRWSVTTWGACGNPCGHGEQVRGISCLLEDVEGMLVVVEERFCELPKPESQKECYAYRPECANSWRVGPWSECSARCGGGQRTRTVQCSQRSPNEILMDDTQVDSSTEKNIELSINVTDLFDLGKPEPPNGERIDSGTIVSDEKCVADLRPPGERPCNVHPCPDGRRVRLQVSDGRPPKNIKLHSRFSLRCPLAAPAPDNRSRRFYWFKNGVQLTPLEEKYVLLDSRGELRVKNAIPEDTGTYSCAVFAAGKGHSRKIEVTLDMVIDPEEDLLKEHVSGSRPPLHDFNGENAKDIYRITEQHASRRRRQAINESVPEVLFGRFLVSNFSACSAPCGPSGMQRRMVRCVNESDSSPLPLSACEHRGDPPEPQRPCNRIDCHPRWQWQEWSDLDCSRSCGGGWKRRRPTCSQTLVDGSLILLGPENCIKRSGIVPPEQKRRCKADPCTKRARVGSSLQLKCEPESDPVNTTLVWLRENQVLPLSTGKYEINNETAELRIGNVTEDDAGMYYCQENDNQRAFHVMVFLPKNAKMQLIPNCTCETCTTPAPATSTTVKKSEWPKIERILSPHRNKSGSILGIFT